MKHVSHEVRRECSPVENVVLNEENKPERQSPYGDITYLTHRKTSMSADITCFIHEEKRLSEENPKHPAPLPAPPAYQGPSTQMKPSPSKPQLKISRDNREIVLSWNMQPTADVESISSYQLFAYQEGSAAPSPQLWKNVGNMDALPLPMACTLAHFQEGNIYHFAVRAMDKHKGRKKPAAKRKVVSSPDVSSDSDSAEEKKSSWKERDEARKKEIKQKQADADKKREAEEEKRIKHEEEKMAMENEENSEAEQEADSPKSTNSKSEPESKVKEEKTPKGSKKPEQKESAKKEQDKKAQPSKEAKKSESKASSEEKPSPSAEEKKRKEAEEKRKAEEKNREAEEKKREAEEKRKQAEKRQKEKEEARRREAERERKREEEKEMKKMAKLEQKRKEKVHIVQIENTIGLMDQEIKKSLEISANSQPDVDKCVAVLEELEKLPLNALLLKKKPGIDLVTTIKKCRKYKGSERVRRKADFIYNRFKALFMSGDDTVTKLIAERSKESPTPMDPGDKAENKENHATTSSSDKVKEETEVQQTSGDLNNVSSEKSSDIQNDPDVATDSTQQSKTSPVTNTTIGDAPNTDMSESVDNKPIQTESVQPAENSDSTWDKLINKTGTSENTNQTDLSLDSTGKPSELPSEESMDTDSSKKSDRAVGDGAQPVNGVDNKTTDADTDTAAMDTADAVMDTENTAKDTTEASKNIDEASKDNTEDSKDTTDAAKDATDGATETTETAMDTAESTEEGSGERKLDLDARLQELPGLQNMIAASVRDTTSTTPSDPVTSDAAIVGNAAPGDPNAEPLEGSPRDLEARIAQIMKSVEEDKLKYSQAAVPKDKSPRKRSKSAFKTRQYEGEEAVMDDEELHSLLGV